MHEPDDEAAPVRLAPTRGAGMFANGRTQPCSLFVGEGGRWVGMVDEPAQQHGRDEVFGPVLAADSALICLALCDNVRRDRGADVTEELWWRDEDAEYIRHRSSRYPGATDLEPAWTLEAAADPRRIVLDPDPKSRTGAVRIIGNSVSAGFVITIIATGGARAGVTAWKSSGADLRDYEGQG